jgi:riboflavin synthase
VFTGIVREVGTVDAVEMYEGSARLTVRAPRTAAATQAGDSVAVNGVCLTATAPPGADGALAFDAVPETLSRSTLGRLAAGDRVNLEPALRAGDPLGGHIVQGHVDGLARVTALEPEGDGARLIAEVPPPLARLCVEKGSIALDGVSLTIAELGPGPGTIAVALVPHTLAETTLGRLAPGDDVNVEADILAKHVERLLEARDPIA